MNTVSHSFKVWAMIEGKKSIYEIEAFTPKDARDIVLRRNHGKTVIITKIKKVRQK